MSYVLEQHEFELMITECFFFGVKKKKLLLGQGHFKSYTFVPYLSLKGETY